MTLNGMVDSFCNFGYGDSGDCEMCDQVSTEDDCFGTEKGIADCERVCFSKFHLEKLEDI